MSTSTLHAPRVPKVSKDVLQANDQQALLNQALGLTTVESPHESYQQSLPSSTLATALHSRLVDMMAQVGVEQSGMIDLAFQALASVPDEALLIGLQAIYALIGDVLFEATAHAE